MEPPFISVSAAVLCATGVALLGLAYAIRVRFDGVDHAAFAAFTASLAAGAFGAALGFGAGLGFDEELLFVLAQTPISVAAIAWLVFAVRYVGRAELVSTRRLVALALPIAAFLPVHVVWAATDGGSLTWDVFFVTWLIAIVYQIGLVSAGVAFLFRAPVNAERVGIGSIVALTIPALAPFLTLLSAPLLVGVAGDRLGPGSFVACYLVCTVAIALSVYRYDALESAAAAAGTAGRDVIFRKLDDAILVVDDRERLVEVNAAARETFDAATADVLGEPFESLTGVTVDELAAPSTHTLETVDGVRRFHAQTSDLLDSRGRRYGVAVSLRDVTDRDLREQRIRILNRVLRHNLRNKLTVVRGSAEVVSEAEEIDHYARLIVEASDELLELGEQARTIETILRDRRPVTEPTAVDVVVERVVDDARDTFPNATIETSIRNGGRVRADVRALEYVLRELVENGVVHNDSDDPRVEVAIESCEERNRTYVSVVDDGPGIPDEELAAIRRGKESPLEHASGLDLWAVYWVVVLHGGALTFEANDPRGTVVKLDLPRAAACDGELAPEGG